MPVPHRFPLPRAAHGRPAACAAGMLALLASTVAQAQSLNEASLQAVYSQIEALRQQLVQEQFAAPAATPPPSVSPLSLPTIQPVKPGALQPETERSAAELQKELAQRQLELGQLQKQESEKSRQELLQKLMLQTKQKQQELALVQKQPAQIKEQQQTQKQQESEKTKLMQQELTEKEKELTQKLLEKTRQQQEEPVGKQFEQAEQQPQESIQKQPEQAEHLPDRRTLAAYLSAGQGDQQAQAQLAEAPDAGIAVTAGAIAVTGTVADTQTLIAAAAATIASASSHASALSSSMQDALQRAGQLSAVAAAQSQQLSQQSQQLSYEYVTAGLVTPMASWPTNLVATYNGNVSGTLNNGAAVSGTFQAMVDFSTIHSMAPSIPGSMTFAGGQGSTSFTLTQMGGYIGGSMSGTYGGQAVSGYVMNGVLYGPAAEQMAGQWSMQNAAATLTGNGNFQARR
ncbi:hypothetical protein [Herbaspirillum sp. SJZ099]|uniref:hypothetical protein n=1 Tax=Herbaspirillum sp. SJZ099 TaxID=2572916 RepID=UPI0011A482D6|nr:hypothetical protein [Herbaspirillum sp. SJZ099]TWC63192.1 hypothetical protein FB597_11138 [Herbaspirillum sp. SJZ099]